MKPLTPQYLCSVASLKNLWYAGFHFQKSCAPYGRCTGNRQCHTSLACVFFRPYGAHSVIRTRRERKTPTEPTLRARNGSVASALVHLICEAVQMVAENGVSEPTLRAGGNSRINHNPRWESIGLQPESRLKNSPGCDMSVRSAGSKVAIRENWLIPAWKGCVGLTKKSSQVGQVNQSAGIVVASYAHHRNGANANDSKAANSRFNCQSYFRQVAACCLH